MSDSSNNIIPDLWFEELGWKGWDEFKARFEEIKKDYDEYGDIVLEKKLGESKDIYKDAFSKKDDLDFIREIYEIWKDRYHHVAKTFDDIISYYEEYYKKGFFIKNSLESEYLKSGKDSNISLQDAFYHQIVKEASQTYEKTVLVLKGSNLYEFVLENKGIGGEYKYDIKMKKRHIIKID